MVFHVGIVVRSAMINASVTLSRKLIFIYCTEIDAMVCLTNMKPYNVNTMKVCRVSFVDDHLLLIRR